MPLPIHVLPIILFVLLGGILLEKVDAREIQLSIQGIPNKSATSKSTTSKSTTSKSATSESLTSSGSRPSTNLSGHMLAFSDLNIILTSDDSGQFHSIVEGSRTIDLPDGENDYTFIYENEILQGTLIIDKETPLVIEIPTEKLGARRTTAESIPSRHTPKTEGKTIRRLSAVHVKTETSSDKKVLSVEEARQLPGSGGDVLGSLSSLPGVVGGLGLDTSLFIRGGREEDVSYRYNDIIIGSPYHETFFFSVFPPEIISELIFYPGGHPTEYDNVQGSVIDLVGRDFYDYQDPYNVTISTSIVSASASISFQFLDKFRLTLGGRRSYFEAYIAIADSLGLLDDLGEFELIPTFYDTHLLFEWQIDPTRNFKFLFLFSEDSFHFNTMSSEFAGTNPEDMIFIDAAFSSGNLWDSEAIIYHSEQAGYTYHSVIYRYAERSSRTSQGFERYNLTNEEYSLRQGVDIFLNDLVTLKTYGKVAIDRGYGGNYIHPEGRALPNPDEYLANSSSGMPSALEFEQFLTDITEYSSELERSDENFIRERLVLGASVLFSLQQFRFDLGGIFYVDDTSAERINGDFRLRGTYLPALENLNLEIFWYAGRYIQYPRAITQNSDATQVFVQDYALRTPHTYQFGLGAQLAINHQFEFSVEPYYKLFFEQTILNPTYDTGYDKVDGNFPSVNFSEGEGIGADFLIKRTGKSWFTGWVSYTWSRILLDQPSISVNEDFDRAFVQRDSANNGTDYREYHRVRVPFDQDITHSIKLIPQFKLSKSVALSFRFIANSGLPHTPQVIGYDSTFHDEGCTPDTFNQASPCDLGYIFVDDPNQINSLRQDWSFTLDARLDWVYAKRGKFQASLFIDIFSLQAFFYTNPGDLSYDRQTIASNTNISVGDPAPTNATRESDDGLVLPVIGFEFQF